MRVVKGSGVWPSLFAGLLLGVCGLASEVWAGSGGKREASVSLTNTFVGEYRGDFDEGLGASTSYGALLNRMNIHGMSSGLSASLRLDTMGFVQGTQYDLENRVELERLSVHARVGRWTLSGGDYYKQLGRGMALSIRKADEVGLDLAIRGAMAEVSWSRGRASFFQANIFMIVTHMD